MYRSRCNIAIAAFPCVLALCGIAAAQVPPGGYTLVERLDKPLKWSDGVQTAVDVRYPDATAPAKGWPMVACFHSNGASRRGIKEMAIHVARQGYCTFAFDIRGNGVTKNIPNLDDSFGRITLDNAEGFYVMEKQLGALVDSDALAAVGRSLGGQQCLRLGAYSGRKLPQTKSPGWVANGPVIKAIAPMIASIETNDRRVAPKTFLLGSEFARDLAKHKSSEEWKAALAGDYRKVRALIAQNSTAEVLAKLRGNNVAVLAQVSWDDIHFPPELTMDVLSSLGTHYKGLITAPGHKSPSNEIDKLLMRDTAVRWFDFHVKSIQNGIDKEPKFETSVTPLDLKTYNDVSSAWGHRFAEQWPPQTPVLKLYLRSNGTLAATAPTQVEPDQVIRHTVPNGYDLDSYVADGGGKNPQRVFNRIPLVERTYVSAPLAEDLEIYGRPVVRLAVTSNAKPFQIGASLLLRDNQLRGRWICTSVTRGDMTQSMPARISMEEVSHVVPKGTRIVLKLQNIAAETPPGYDQIFWAPEFNSATMRVAISPTHPATLELPVLARPGVSMTPRLASVSATAGFDHAMQIDAGGDMAGAVYVAFMGISGFAPGVFIGTQVWLNPDLMTTLAIGAMNSPMLPNFFGKLDAQGRASPHFKLPPGLTVVAGLRFTMVSLVDLTGDLRASGPVQLYVAK